MTKEALKAQCLQAIDEHQDAIIRIGQEIFSHPELGFKERRTAELVRSTFARSGSRSGTIWPSPASGAI